MSVKINNRTCAMSQLETVLEAVRWGTLYDWAGKCPLVLEIDGSTFQFIDLSEITVRWINRTIHVYDPPSTLDALPELYTEIGY